MIVSDLTIRAAYNALTDRRDSLEDRARTLEDRTTTRARNDLRNVRLELERANAALEELAPMVAEIHELMLAQLRLSAGIRRQELADAREDAGR